MYTTASSRRSKINYTIEEEDQEDKAPECQGRRQRRTVMCCPPSDTAAAMPSS